MSRPIRIFNAQLMLGDGAREKLAGLESRTGLTAEGVFEEAVEVYALAVENRAAGRDIAAVSAEDKTCRTVRLPGLQNVPPGPMEHTEIKNTRDLQPVMNKTGLDLREIFNEALALYGWAVERRAEGKIIGPVDPEKEVFIGEFPHPGLQHVKPRAA